MAEHPFKVIDGAVAPAKPRAKRKASKPATMLRCHRCEGSALIVVLLGAETRNGKVRGGQKNHICANCFQQGQYVLVAF